MGANWGPINGCGEPELRYLPTKYWAVYLESVDYNCYLIVGHEPGEVAIEGAGKPEQGDEGGDHVNHQQRQGQHQDIPGDNVLLRRCPEGRDVKSEITSLPPL